MPEPTVTIHAVHERNIDKYWDSLKLPDSQLCYVCKEPVTKKNVAAFVPIDGKVEVVCDKPLCFFNLHYMKHK